jgi:YjbE family integral membrane protein
MMQAPAGRMPRAEDRNIGEAMTAQFWGGLMTIAGVNIALSADNAVVIALATRKLAPGQRRAAIAWGCLSVIVARIALTAVAVELLRLPGLKLAGAVALLWIAARILVPGDEAVGVDDGVSSLLAAVRALLAADVVMSLDNVLAVAAAAGGNLALLVPGLAISIPLVMFGAALIHALMDRLPIIVTLGAALVGWVAGGVAVTDPLMRPWVEANAAWLHAAAPAAGAVAVVVLGRWLAARARQGQSAAPPRNP